MGQFGQGGSEPTGWYFLGNQGPLAGCQCEVRRERVVHEAQADDA